MAKQTLTLPLARITLASTRRRPFTKDVTNGKRPLSPSPVTHR